MVNLRALSSRESSEDGNGDDGETHVDGFCGVLV